LLVPLLVLAQVVEPQRRFVCVSFFCLHVAVRRHSGQMDAGDDRSEREKQGHSELAHVSAFLRAYETRALKEAVGDLLQKTPLKKRH
jgi:hypothetical protein